MEVVDNYGLTTSEFYEGVSVSVVLSYSALFNGHPSSGNPLSQSSFSFPTELSLSFINFVHVFRV